MKKHIFTAVSGAVAFLLAACYAPSNPALGGVALAQAPFAAEAQLMGLRQACWGGSRQACIRFGMIIGENRQRHADWRRAHPDWWEWERW